ncbi:MarR family winged helix-turn-helix transcriptional regulator [Celeribacter sp.]|uniref:MarR family winged helix-turn-helix transcriptional regulator n=1 Tax=Celeribacter sp. TaxID=1890673 RepID=UPI003A8F5C68
MRPADQLYAGIQLTRPLLRNITARVEHDLQGTGITVGQRAILEVLLALDHATAPQITAHLDVTRQFVGRELKSLVAEGKLETEENLAHRASKFYRLTERSRAQILSIRRRETQEIDAFAQGFTEEEIRGFYKTLTALNVAFKETPKEKQ